MRNRLGPLRSKSRWNAPFSRVVDCSREMAACWKLKACWPWMSAMFTSSRRPCSAIAHETDLHQFMLYTPVPGTPLYSEMAEQGRLLDVNMPDIHGQHAFNFQHAAISREQSTTLLNGAFQRDFERNGPSLFRICRTTFTGYMRYKNHPDRRIRERWQRE